MAPLYQDLVWARGSLYLVWGFDLASRGVQFHLLWGLDLASRGAQFYLVWGFDLVAVPKQAEALQLVSPNPEVSLTPGRCKFQPDREVKLTLRYR